jgi:hypothetical protein
MAQAQALDPKAFPDQGGASAAPSTSGGLDPASFPDQPAGQKKTPKPPDTRVQKAASKATGIEPAGGVLYESIPGVTGAGGAIVGGAAGAGAGAPTGPGAAAATYGGALIGAGTGGMYGRYLQFLARQTLGRTKFGQDWLGVPPPKDLLTEVDKTAKQAGQEASTQMETEAIGQGIAAPLGFIRRGGFLNKNREVMARYAEDKALGTRLSGPEIASGTPTGEIAKTLQSYAGGAFGAGQIQKKVREQGTKASMKVIDDALAMLGHPGVGGGPTQTSRGPAAAAREQVGKLLDFAADRAPAVDVTAVKDLAAKELEKGIVQHLKAVPDVANPKLAALIRQLRASPQMVQRLPRPVLTQVADAIIEKHQSPTLKLLRRIVGMEDQTKARGLWEELKSLRAMGTPRDELYAKDDKQRLATLFQGKLRESLNTAAPQFAAALGQYRDLVRGDYLRENIVLGGKPVPANETQASEMLTGMAQRLRKATESGRLARDFNDPNGQKVLNNLSRVAALLEKRTDPMSGNMRKIFEIGRLIHAGMGAFSGHPSLGEGSAAMTWEIVPDFFTWLIHDPKATRWFIEGVKAENPTVATGAIIRLGELYRRSMTGQKEKGDAAAGDKGGPKKVSQADDPMKSLSKATGIGPTGLDRATGELNAKREARGLGKVDATARAEMPILPAGKMILKMAERSPEAAMEIIASARQNPKVAQLLSSRRYDELMKKFGGTMLEEGERASTMSPAQASALKVAGKETGATADELAKVKALLFGE